MSRENPPLYVSIKERYLLTRPGSSKETYHLVLDLKGKSFHYEVGDCIGVYPTNSPHHVQELLATLKASGEEPIHDRKGETCSLKNFLSQKAHLGRSTRQLFTILSLGQHPYLEDPQQLRQFLEATPPSRCIKYFNPSSIPLQDFCLSLAPLAPRYYSIASSQKVATDELHLTVGYTKAESENEVIPGVCSHFLCHLAPLNQPVVPIFHHPAKDFKLNSSMKDRPLIMIGPGTGIAPFRGFLQERTQFNPEAKNWLFFGERERANDFYYEEFLLSLVNKGLLKLNTAFSRDQNEKIYVQHLMKKEASTLWKWIEEGAFILVCGDAEKMAKEVDATLQEIIAQEGKLTPEEAKALLRRFRQEGRYLRDVY